MLILPVRIKSKPRPAWLVRSMDESSYHGNRGTTTSEVRLDDILDLDI